MHEHSNGPLPASHPNSTTQFSAYCSDQNRYTVYSYAENDSVVYDGKNVFTIVNILRVGEIPHFVCRLHDRLRPFFTEPLPSDDIDIFIVSNASAQLSLLSLTDVACKGMILSCGDLSVFFCMIA
jgi:hypothetical protein